MTDYLGIAYQLGLGISLSACTGLRAFLPILVVSLLARFHFLKIGNGFEWIGSDATIIVFAVATIIEILADKIGGLDNFLDSIGFVVKPVAATILFSSIFTDIDPFLALVLGLVVGGGTAGAVHFKKASVRALSTLFTFTIVNPIISFIEDLLVSVMVFLSFIAPYIVILMFIFLGCYIFKKLKTIKKPLAKSSELP